MLTKIQKEIMHKSNLRWGYSEEQSKAAIEKAEKHREEQDRLEARDKKIAHDIIAICVSEGLKVHEAQLILDQSKSILRAQLERASYALDVQPENQNPDSSEIHMPEDNQP